MKYLLFFTALIATASALECDCSGACAAATTCTVQAGKCYSLQREISTGKDTTVKATIKGCVDSGVESTVCAQGFGLISSGNEFYLMSNITCCDKDSCNKNITAGLNKNSPNSDRSCPSCFALNKTTCDAKSMKCTNLQNKCLNITGTAKKGAGAALNFIAMGCAAENSIFRKDVRLTFGDTIYTFNTVQSAGQMSSCLSFAIFLPSVLWFLLDRSLY